MRHTRRLSMTTLMLSCSFTRSLVFSMIVSETLTGGTWNIRCLAPENAMTTSTKSRKATSPLSQCERIVAVILMALQDLQDGLTPRNQQADDGSCADNDDESTLPSVGGVLE